MGFEDKDGFDFHISDPFMRLTMEEKKKINWKKRQSLLKKIFSKKKNNYDCIVPVSGGKDGSYIAHTLKKKYKINPLCVTVRPPLELELGNTNLRNFINSGYDHIHVAPNHEVMRDLNTKGFKLKGFPYYGWLISIFTSVLYIAASMNIDLIVYGEDGEVEYGGSNLTKNRPFFLAKNMDNNDVVGNLICESSGNENENFGYEFESFGHEIENFNHEIENFVNEIENF